MIDITKQRAAEATPIPRKQPTQAAPAPVYNVTVNQPGAPATAPEAVATGPSDATRAAIESVHGEGGPRDPFANQDQPVYKQAGVAPVDGSPEASQALIDEAQGNVVRYSQDFRAAEAAPVEGSPEASQAAIDQQSPNRVRVGLTADQQQQATDDMVKSVRAYELANAGLSETSLAKLHELNPGVDDAEILRIQTDMKARSASAVSYIRDLGEYFGSTALEQSKTQLAEAFYGRGDSAILGQGNGELSGLDRALKVLQGTFITPVMGTIETAMHFGVGEMMATATLASPGVRARYEQYANAYGIDAWNPANPVARIELVNQALMDSYLHGTDEEAAYAAPILIGNGYIQVMSALAGGGTHMTNAGLGLLKNLGRTVERMDARTAAGAARFNAEQAKIALAASGGLERRMGPQGAVSFEGAARIGVGPRLAALAADNPRMSALAMRISETEALAKQSDLAAASRAAAETPGAATNEALATARGQSFAEGTGGALKEGQSARDIAAAKASREVVPARNTRDVIAQQIRQARTSGFGRFAGDFVTGTGGQATVDFASGAMLARGAAKLAGRVATSAKRGLGVREPNVAIRNVADKYRKLAGIETGGVRHPVTVHEPTAKRMADFYEAATSTPEDPQVQRAYKAFNRETEKQAAELVKAGYKAEPWTGTGQPYKDSAAMRADVLNNKHIWYFKTEAGAPIHDLMTAEQNDRFRWVHDIFGHAMEGNQFGANGEENAWSAHASMYGLAAQKAMTTETRLQNSAVNFGKNGAANRANPAATIFPDQKALLPHPDFLPRRPSQSIDRYAIRQRFEAHSNPELADKAARWYKDAANIAHEWSSESGMGGTFGRENIAASMAALSPQQAWTNEASSLDNLKAAYNLLKEAEQARAAHGADAAKFPPDDIESLTGQSNRQAMKAWDALFAKDPWSLLKGNKERPFGMNIADVGNRAVIDTHVRGAMPSLSLKSKMAPLTFAEHSRIQQAYADTLAELKAEGKLPQDFTERDMQALDWGIISGNDLAFRKPMDWAAPGNMPHPAMPKEPDADYEGALTAIFCGIEELG